jgi:hypothetical protein
MNLAWLKVGGHGKTRFKTKPTWQPREKKKKEEKS